MKLLNEYETVCDYPDMFDVLRKKEGFEFVKTSVVWLFGKHRPSFYYWMKVVWESAK